MRGTRPRHWLVALVVLALALVLGSLVATHIANVATDRATQAIEDRDGPAPPRPGG